MPTITIVPIQVLDATGVSSGTRQWPPTLDSFKLTLLDASFTSGAVQLDIDFSWDGGATWPYHDTNQWTAGAKARDGSAPSVALGPYRKTVNGVDTTVNPTHGRATIKAVSGSPDVGVSLTA